MFYIYFYAFGFFKNFQKNINPEALFYWIFGGYPLILMGYVDHKTAKPLKSFI